MKKYVFLSLIILLSFSCSPSKDKAPKENPRNSISNTDKEKEQPLTAEQETAFEALNILQRNVEINHIYSTFPSIEHAFLPPDSTFTISQAELLAAITEIYTSYGHTLTEVQSEKVLAESVLALEQYEVKSCRGYLFHENNSRIKTLPGEKRKTWLLSNILGRRDLILMW